MQALKRFRRWNLSELTSDVVLPVALIALLVVSLAGCGSVGAAQNSARETQSPDPRVVYATYLGGVRSTWASGIGVDDAGNAYVAGAVGAGLPNGNPLSLQPNAGGSGSSVAGGTGGFVTRLSPRGNAIKYRLHVPGTITGIAVDGAGDAYLTGYTRSRSFPMVHALQGYRGGSCVRPISGTFPCFDAFVTKLSPSGHIIYSTYLGGRWNDGGTAIAIDRAGAAYITGFTNSSDFPLKLPIQKHLHNLVCQSWRPSWPACAVAFITKIAPDGRRIAYSTYLAGTSTTCGNAIAVDSAGHAYVTGIDDIGIGNRGFDFPRVHPLPAKPGSLFVAKLSTDGRRLLYSSTLNGTGWGLAIDGRGNAFVASHAFVLKLSPNGQHILYRTDLGSLNQGITIDAAGHAFVTGTTVSSAFANVHPVQSPGGGACSDEGETLPCPDAFILELDPTGGHVLFGSHLGGSTAPEAGTGVAADRKGNVYLAGYTETHDFPTVHAIQPHNLATTSASGDPGVSAFVVKLDLHHAGG